MSLEQALNTPRNFILNGKEYIAKRINIFELSSIRQAFIDKINKGWMERISTLANLIGDKDRTKFLLSAIKEKPDYDTEIREDMMSQDGIKLVLSKSLKIDVIEAEQLLNNVSMDQLLEVFSFALDSDTKESKEVKEEVKVVESKNV